MIKNLRLAPTVFLSLSLLSPSAADSQPIVIGSEFQVNTYTTDDQTLTAVAVDDDGRFVVIWEDDSGRDGDRAGIFGQLFEVDGSRLGGEFQVNSLTTGRQLDPSVAISGNGDFMVVWRSAHTAKTVIRSRRFDVDGTALGEELQVNTSAVDVYHGTAVAADAADGFVVVWTDYPGLFDWNVYGRRFGSDGTAMGEPFRINTLIDHARRGAVAADPGGGFVVVWTGGVDGDSADIAGRRFAPDGTALGNPFRINTHTAYGQYHPKVATDEEGSYIVVWTSESQEGVDFSDGVFGQRLAPTGTPLGDEFQINTYVTSNQSHPELHVEPDGSFLVVWNSWGQDGSQHGVFAQQYGSDGMPRGGEFQVNTYTTGIQSAASVAASPSGDAVVVWSSNFDDSFNLYGQRYHLFQIFADGFESGDPGFWSHVVP